METTNNKCSQCIYNDNCIEKPENCPSFIDKYSVTESSMPIKPTNVVNHTGFILLLLQ